MEIIEKIGLSLFALIFGFTLMVLLYRDLLKKKKKLTLYKVLEVLVMTIFAVCAVFVTIRGIFNGDFT